MRKALRWFTLWAGWRPPVAADIPSAVPFIPTLGWEWEWDDLRAQLVAAGLPVADIAFRDVRWYVCDDIPVRVLNAAQPLGGVKYDPRTVFAGVWLGKDRSITIRRDALNDRTLLRHEMTHAMQRTGGHGADWFCAAFGNYTGPQPEQLTEQR